MTDLRCYALIDAPAVLRGHWGRILFSLFCRFHEISRKKTKPTVLNQNPNKLGGFGFKARCFECLSVSHFKFSAKTNTFLGRLVMYLDLLIPKYITVFDRLTIKEVGGCCIIKR